MMAGMKLDMGRSLLAEGAARQFRPEGLSEEVDDLLRGSGGVGDVQSRMALIVAIAHFQSLFDGELETSSFPILFERNYMPYSNAVQENLMHVLDTFQVICTQLYSAIREYYT